jgi:hypothetical protein
VRRFAPVGCQIVSLSKNSLLAQLVSNSLLYHSLGRMFHVRNAEI